MRKAKKGEKVCDCSAYYFPHRFGGGKCKGFWIVEETWAKNYGGGGCKNCNNFESGICQVLEGREEVNLCPIWQDYVNYNEIRIYKPR